MTLKTLMMSAAMSALIAGGAIAQTDTDAVTDDGAAVVTDDTAVAPAFTSIGEMSVSDLVGQTVYQPDGTKIGDVDYVVGDPNGASAVIGIGGFLGLGEYTVALPLGELGYDSAQQMVTLNTTKDALKEQAEFDESDVESLPEETPLADLMGDMGATDSGAMSEDMGSDPIAGDTEAEGMDSTDPAMPETTEEPAMPEAGDGTDAEMGSGDAVEGGMDDTTAEEPAMPEGDDGTDLEMDGGDAVEEGMDDTTITE